MTTPLRQSAPRDLKAEKRNDALQVERIYAQLGLARCGCLPEDADHHTMDDGPRYQDTGDYPMRVECRTCGTSWREETRTPDDLPYSGYPALFVSPDEDS